MLSPALPSEVGTVALSDVCDAGCKHYVENFENYLLPVEDQVFTKGPKVMVPPGDWEELTTNLVKHKVIEESEVYHVQDKPLLNGLFGVSKGDWSGEIEVHRLIMNLIPLNRICRGIEGDIATLPSWSSMGPLSLDIDEDLISSEDVKCFFYILKYPFLGIGSWPSTARCLRASVRGNQEHVAGGDRSSDGFQEFCERCPTCASLCFAAGLDELRSPKWRGSGIEA